MKRTLLLHALLPPFLHASADALFNSFGATRNLKDTSKTAQKRRLNEDSIFNIFAEIHIDTSSCSMGDGKRVQQVIQNTVESSGNALLDIVKNVTGSTDLAGNVTVDDVAEMETNSQGWFSWGGYSSRYSYSRSDWYGTVTDIDTQEADEETYVAEKLAPLLAEQAAELEQFTDKIEELLANKTKEIEDLKIKYGWNALVAEYNELKAASGSRRRSLLEAFEHRKLDSGVGLEEWWEKNAVTVGLYRQELSQINLKYENLIEGFHLAEEALEQSHLEQIEKTEAQARAAFLVAQAGLRRRVLEAITDEDYAEIVDQLKSWLKDSIETNLWNELQNSTCFQSPPTADIELK